MKKYRVITMILMAVSVFCSAVPFHVEAQESDVAGGEGTVQEAAGQEMVLFVQEGCSHCAKVEAYLEENGLTDVLTIKDTTADPDASEEYVNELERLGVPLEESGVPMLIYDGDQYLTGDTPIISFLDERFDIEPQEEEESAVADSSDYVILAGGGIFVGSILGYGIVKVVNERRAED